MGFQNFSLTDILPVYMVKTKVFFGGPAFIQPIRAIIPKVIACLPDQNKRSFFGGPAFIQLIKAI